jgi:ABC-type multidrug transport system permease subunit
VVPPTIHAGDDLALELRAALAIARKELRMARRYPLNLVNEVLQPLYQFLLPSMLLGATFFVGGRALGLQESTGTTDLAGFLFLGILVAGLVATGFWELAYGFKREMDTGTLEPLFLTPTRPSTLVLGRALSGMLIAVAASTILLAIATAFLGASIAGAVLVAVPALLLAAASMVGIGFLVAAGVLLLREPNFFVDSTNFAFSMLCGTAFPVLALPGVLRWMAYLLPPTYALDLIRVSGLGTRPLLPPTLEWLVLVALAAISMVVGLAAFRRVEHHMRVKGTLGQH